MHFQPLLFTLVAFSGAALGKVEARSSGHTECTWTGTSSVDPNLDLAAMRTCLENYNQGGWDGAVCATRGWFKGGRSWASSEDCYGLCHSCLSDAIANRWPNARCSRSTQQALCWMGYQ